MYIARIYVPNKQFSFVWLIDGIIQDMFYFKQNKKHHK